MTKMTQAQIEANERYRKANIRQILVKVNKKTMPNIYEYLEGVENTQRYILELIRRDMIDNGVETDDILASKGVSLKNALPE